MSGVKITVRGMAPVPQGSKTVGVTRKGRAYVRETAKGLPAWRALVVAQARRQYQVTTPLDGPLFVTYWFRFPRPKYHYRTGRYASELKPDAPLLHSFQPDLDKLVRAVNDALTLAGVIADDARISRIYTWKDYTNDPQQPQAAKVALTAQAWLSCFFFAATFVSAVITTARDWAVESSRQSSRKGANDGAVSVP